MTPCRTDRERGGRLKNIPKNKPPHIYPELPTDRASEHMPPTDPHALTPGTVCVCVRTQWRTVPGRDQQEEGSWRLVFD